MLWTVWPQVRATFVWKKVCFLFGLIWHFNGPHNSWGTAVRILASDIGPTIGWQLASGEGIDATKTPPEFTFLKKLGFTFTSTNNIIEAGNFEPVDVVETDAVRAGDSSFWIDDLTSTTLTTSTWKIKNQMGIQELVEYELVKFELVKPNSSNEWTHRTNELIKLQTRQTNERMNQLVE